MNKNALKAVQYVGSFLLAIGIIYFLFKNQDPVKLIAEVKKVDSKWVLFSMLFGSIAILSRGLRWLVLIDALSYRTSKLNSIAAVSIGYFTNLFIPRAGEITRCTSLSQYDKIPVDKLFGTILIERVIDFIFLFGLIILTFIVKFNELIMFYNNIIVQNGEQESNLLLLTFIVLGVIFSILLIKKWLKKSALYEKILTFIQGLKTGFKSILIMKNKRVFWFHTLNIWVMYFLMTYICFFSMEATSQLTLGDGLFLLVLGGIGMVIPTPGGIGSYHAIVMIGLSVLGVGSIFLEQGGDTANPALIFPTIMHAGQTLVAIIMGSAGLLFLFTSKKQKHVNS